MTKSIILLSGGLDSLVSLGLKSSELNVKMAITFDYGQKAKDEEILASKKICNYYGIEHKIIYLDWLKEITKTSLVSDEKIPEGEELLNEIQSAKSVWIPNRNGLFLNIAGAFADSFGYDYIIIGANKEEAETFSDNTEDFINAINNEFQYSTQTHSKVVAPLINCNKNDIVRLALENNIPLELVYSCYQKGTKHCGKCESCKRLLNALNANNDTHYKEILFR